MAILNFEIGATFGSKVNVETLTTASNMGPRSIFFPFGETVVTGSRARVTRGAAYTIWEWGYIKADMFNALRALCTGGSAAVVIRTLKEDYATYEYYDCVMVWPGLDSYEYTAGKYQPFSLRFDNLVVHV